MKRCKDGKYHVVLVPHLIAPLLGRFKNETGERNVLIPLPNVTANRLKIRVWIERLVEVLKKEGRQDQPSAIIMMGFYA